MDPLDHFVAHARALGGPAHAPPTARPTTGVLIVTCMDARIDPVRMFGLASGDSHIVRNAGAVVTEDVIRSVAVSQQMLGTRHVMVMGHTGCGLEGLSEESFADQLEKVAGTRPRWTAGTFADVADSVADAVRRLTDSPFVVTEGPVRGFVYDVSSGRLDEVRPL